MLGIRNSQILIYRKRFRCGKRPEYSVIHLSSCYTVGIFSVITSACKRPFLYSSIFFCRQLSGKRVYCGFQITRCVFVVYSVIVKSHNSHIARRKQGHIPGCAGNTVSVIADHTPCGRLIFMVLPEIHGRCIRCVYSFIQCVCAKLYRPLQTQAQRAFLLNIVICQRAPVLKLFFAKKQSLRIGRKARFIPNFFLDIVNAVARLNLER